MVRALPGKHPALIPLALWAVSFFLPAITYDGNDWLFPGANPGILACFMSMVSLYFGLGTLAKFHFLSDNLPFVYFGSLWIVNIWMIRAPFEVSKIEQGRARWLLIALWIGTILPVPLPFVLRRLHSTETLGIGFYAWLLSVASMALVMTALYVGLNKTLHFLARIHVADEKFRARAKSIDCSARSERQPVGVLRRRVAIPGCPAHLR